MPTTYGADAEITGSLAVDGAIDLGSGDDDVTIDGTTLTIDSSNNRVGIGTSSPSYKLHVNASAADTTSQITAYFRSADTDYSRISVDSTANADTQISFMNNGSTKWTIGNEAAVDSFYISSSFGEFGADAPLIINASGNTSFGGDISFPDVLITELSIPNIDLQTNTNAFRFNCPYGLTVTGLRLHLDQHTTSGDVTVTVTNTTDTNTMITLSITGTNLSANTTTVSNASADQGDIITFAITATPANAQGLRATLEFKRDL